MTTQCPAADRPALDDHPEIKVMLVTLGQVGRPGASSRVITAGISDASVSAGGDPRPMSK